MLGSVCQLIVYDSLCHFYVNVLEWMYILAMSLDHMPENLLKAAW